MNKQVEVLKQDIEKLFAKMVEERNPIVEEFFRDFSDKIVNIKQTNTIKTKDYRQYRKLFDTLRSLINILPHNERKLRDDIMSKISSEMELIHELADDALEDNRYEQYRCLMDIYTKGISMSNTLPNAIGISSDDLVSKTDLDELLKEIPNNILKELKKTGMYSRLT